MFLQLEGMERPKNASDSQKNFRSQIRTLITTHQVVVLVLVVVVEVVVLRRGGGGHLQTINKIINYKQNNIPNNIQNN